MPTPKHIHIDVKPSTATPAADSETGSPGNLTAAHKRYSLGDHVHVLLGKVRRALGAGALYLQEALFSPNGSIDIVADPEGEGLLVQVKCSEELPLQDGIAASGDPNDKPASIKHVHPLVEAASVGGKLYTAVVADKYKRADVDAVFRTAGGCTPGLFESGWTQIATGVWRHDISGPLNDSHNEIPHWYATDDVPTFAGMRLLAWSGSLSDAERAKSGIYVMTDTGDPYVDPVTHEMTLHYATLARAPDCATSAQVYNGIWCHVAGGTIYGPGSTGFPDGATFQLSTPDPIELGVTPLTWSIVSTPAVSPSNELLTAAQLSLASPDIVVAGAAVSAGTGEVEIVTCTERTADLAGVTIPGDKPIVCHVRACVGVDDPTATTVIRVYLRGTNDPSWHLVGTTQPLHNVDAGDFVCPAGTLGADYVMGIGEEMEAKYVALSDRADGATVALTYNNPTHSTFIELPLTFGYAGTDEHDKLTKPSRWLLHQHPKAASDDVAEPSAGTDGNFDVPVSANTLIIPEGATIQRISTANWPDGWASLRLFFPNGGHLYNGADAQPPYAGLDLGTFGGLSGAQGEMMDFNDNGVVHLFLNGSAWLLDSAPNMGNT